MKIAAVSDDGVTLSQHFGRAPLYVVVTVENGQVVDRETREKSGHHIFAAHHQRCSSRGAPRLWSWVSSATCRHD